MIEEGIENLAKNHIPGNLKIDIKVLDNNKVEVSFEMIIKKKTKNTAQFENKYANEITHWPDHIRLLNRIKKYRITSKTSSREVGGKLHLYTHLILPCL
jgi:hypothetical protein